MPWKETHVVEERLKFVTAAIEGDWPIADLCRAFGISRKTGYKYIERYERFGIDGLQDRSRAPILQAQKTPTEMVDMILDFRRIHPNWGPRKILKVLERTHPSIIDWPASSTVGEILKRHGLIAPQKRRRRTPSSGGVTTTTPERANHVWCADFKGYFRTGDTRRCDPLTVSDAYSRFLIGCRAVTGTGFEAVRPGFIGFFERYGLPDIIRTDNGPPFATTGMLGLSQLSVWWIKLGIKPERILPGRPDQNGAHERMHRTLKAETASPPQANLRLQQRAFDRFRKEYNVVRPHEALNDRTPAEFYKPSPRPYPLREPVIHYPDHFDVKKVRRTGAIRINRVDVHITQALSDEYVGLENVSDRHVRIYFLQVPLAIYDLELRKVMRFPLIPEE